MTDSAEMPSSRQVDFGNDWAYDGCADCIVGEPHICTSYERKRPRRHYEEADCAGGW